MTRTIYLDDPYQKECTAVVKEVREDNVIVLDQTIFYPFSGGQANDTGTLTAANGTIYAVTDVRKADDEILHTLKEPHSLKPGDSIHCTIDWNRRYALMRMHTAAHLLSALLYTDAQIMITGNELQPEQSRVDFSLEETNTELLKKTIEKANELIKKSTPIKVYTLPREEAMKIPGIVKLANALPPTITHLRIVEIEGIDIEADGGTHVKNL